MEPTDLTQSMWGDMLAQVGGDEARARELVQGMNEVSQEQKNQALAEAKQNFTTLPDETLNRILSQYKWNFDEAISPLFAAAEEYETCQRALQAEQQRQRTIETQQRVTVALKGILTPELKIKLQELLEQNDGDVDDTVEQFLSTIRNEEQFKKQQELERKENLVTMLHNQFTNFSRVQIEQELSKCSWNWEQAASNLLSVMEAQKINQLKFFCDKAQKTTTHDQLQAALVANSWNVRDARDALLREVTDEEEKQNSAPVEDFMERSMRFNQRIKSSVCLQDPLLAPCNELVREIGLERVAGLDTEEQDSIQRMPPPVNDLEQSELIDENKPSQLVSNEQESEFTVSLTLSVSEKPNNRIDQSETLAITWKSNDDSWKPTSYDWIGLFTPGSESYQTYQYIASASNVVEIPLSRVPLGEYTCRYFSKQHKACLGVSPSFIVGPEYQITSQQKVNEGTGENEVTLEIKQLSGDAPYYPWIGMYLIGDDVVPNKKYVNYQRLNSGNSPVFVAPKAGTWEFRIFPRNNYECAASHQVVVRGEDTLRLTIEKNLVTPQIFVHIDLQTRDCSTDRPWIGVYKVGETNPRMYRRCRNINKNGLSVIQMKAPIHTGEYEARLFSSRNYDAVICKSNSLNIEGI